MAAADVWILGTHSTAFGKFPDRSFKDLTRETYLGVLADAELGSGDDIEFGYVGNCLAGPGFGQDSIRGQAWTLELVDEGLFPERVPIMNVEGACATASMALHAAFKDIRSGESSLVLAVGVEKTYLPGADADPEVKAHMFELFAKGVDQETLGRLEAHYREVGDKAGVPFETGPGRTMFMDTYAMQAALHMRRYGTTQAQIAAACAKNHNYGALNPLAQYRFTASTGPGARRPRGVLPAHPIDVRADRRRRRRRVRLLRRLSAGPTALGSGSGDCGSPRRRSRAASTARSKRRGCPR